MKKILLIFLVLLGFKAISQVPSINGILFGDMTPIVEMTSATASGGGWCSWVLVGNVTDDKGLTVTERGHVYSTVSMPTIATGTKYNIQAGTGMGSFSQSMPVFEPNTTYYVRAYAINSAGTSYSPTQISFSTIDRAYASISITYVNSTSIDVNLDITANGNTITSREIFYGISSLNENYNSVGAGGSYVWHLTGLTSGQTYQYQVNVTTNNCSVMSSYQGYGTFITAAGSYPPTVQTNAVTSITDNSAVGNGNVISEGSGSITERGICYDTSSGATTSDDKVVDEDLETGAYSVDLTSLVSGTQYFARAYATSAYGTSYGNEVSFTTTTLYTPSVVTSSISDITQTTASSGGNVTSSGSTSVTARGIYFSSINALPTASDSIVSSGTGTGSFVSDMSGLKQDRTYYVRAFATNTQGTAYGQVVSFKTSSAPAIQLSIINSTINSIDVSYSGSSCPDNIVEIGAVLSSSTRTPSVGVNTKISDFLSGICSFSRFNAFYSLTNSTKYYIRSFLSTSYGTFYSSVDSITTGATIVVPTVTTTAITGIVYGYGASSGGNVTYNGGATVTARGVCWGTSLNPTILNSKTINGSGDGSFSSVVSNLSANTTYHVRAYATNGVGTGYGSDVQFKTWSTYSPNNLGKSLTSPTGTDTENTTIEGAAPSVSVGYSVSGEWKTLSVLDFYPDADADGKDFYTLKYNGTEVTSFPLNINVLSLAVGSNTGLTIEYSDVSGDIFNNAITQKCGVKYNIVNTSDAIGFTHILTEDLYSLPVVTTTAASSITSNSAVSGGNITSSSYVQERGIVWSNTTNQPSITNYVGKTIDGSGIGSFPSYMSNLTTGILYYVRAYARIAEGVSYGSAITVTPTVASVAPTVQTNTVTDITTTEATFSGTVISEGSASVTTRGVCYSTSANPVYTDSNIIYYGAAPETYYGTVYTLTENTLYYYRAFAINSVGVSYGSEYSFTTNAALNVIPTVVLNGGYDSSPTGTNLVSGNVTSDGGATVSERGVCWNTIGSPTTADSHTIASSGGTGIYQVYITNLIAGVTYYFKLYATNSVGTGYSTEYSFTTQTDLPVVVLDSISTITGSSAIGYANVVSNGSGTVSTRGLCWGTNPNPTTSNSIIYGSGGVGTYSFTMSGLYQNTTYYARAFATSEFGVAYSSESSFTTTSQCVVVGDLYLGGTVAYIYNINDAGYVNGECHGIVISNSDVCSSPGCTWSLTYTNISTATTLGSGISNTNNIIADQGAGSYAANSCFNYGSGWCLGSKEDMTRISSNYNQLSEIGLIDGHVYWTSSQYDTYNSWNIVLSSGAMNFASKFNGSRDVRPIKYF